MDKVLEFVKKIISKKINVEISIDATCGRGNDTKFLADISSKVYSFDIQKDAIDFSKESLENYNNIQFINDSHEYVDRYVLEDIDVAMFNLGYLPKGDKNITTQSASTIVSISKMINKLKINGIITVVCYPGHPQGKIESNDLLNYLKDINQKEYDVVRYDFLNQINNPPFAIIIERIK